MWRCFPVWRLYSGTEAGIHNGLRITFALFLTTWFLLSKVFFFLSLLSTPITMTNTTTDLQRYAPCYRRYTLWCTVFWPHSIKSSTNRTAFTQHVLYYFPFYAPLTRTTPQELAFLEIIILVLANLLNFPSSLRIKHMTCCPVYLSHWQFPW